MKKVLKTPAIALIEKHVTRKNRKKVSLYLSMDLYNKFVKACDKHDSVPSRVLEDMIEEFLESLEER